MDVGDDGHPGRHPSGRGVHGGDVVEVQDVGVRRARLLQERGPRVHQPLAPGVVDLGEDAVRGAGAVLEGRVHRRVVGQRV